MRCAVLLGAGTYADEFAGFSNEDGPRLEFMEIAKSTGADVLSFTSAAAQRGRAFRLLFSKFKKVGSAFNLAMLASNYDVIYVTAEGVGLPLAFFLKARRWKGRIVCVFHNMSWVSKRCAIRFLGHDMFAGLVTVNRLQADFLIEQCGIPPEKVISVHNWVDTEFFRPDDRPLPADPVIMACGAENRDYDTLVRAAQSVSCRFVVYGHGFLAGDVKGRSSAPNLHYAPRVSYRELRDAYAAASIVVVPLNDVTYAAGVTGLVEAMAAGRPTIVTRSRGIADYFGSFEPPTVVPPNDPEALVSAILQLRADADLRERLGHHNRAFAEEHCAVDQYAATIRRLMLEGIGPHSSCGPA